MNWKFKAFLHKGLAQLPDPLSIRVHYFLQRRFGGLRHSNPLSRLMAGANIVRYIERHSRSIICKNCLEVGTGHQVALPIALWLCGASRIITVDINPYLSEDLVLDDLEFMRDNKEKVLEIFQATRAFDQVKSRLHKLLSAAGTLESLLGTINAHYLCPADAAALPLEDESIDYHVSYTVLEHIPPEVLRGILIEGTRTLRSDGLFVHCVDFSDHFAHSDDSISSVNFLQYDEEMWRFYAANRYAYHNRLRVDDCLELFKQCGLRILASETIIDEKAVVLLKKGLLHIDERFTSKPVEVNAALHSWIVASPTKDA